MVFKTSCSRLYLKICLFSVRESCTFEKVILVTNIVPARQNLWVEYEIESNASESRR